MTLTKRRKKPVSERTDSEIIRKFRKRIDKKALDKDIKVIYRIRGGLPSEQVEEEFRLSGNGQTKVMVRDELRSIPVKRASGKLNRIETRNLFKKIGAGLDSAVPRSEASFIPDSLIGTITIETDGEEVTLYFLADDENRLAQDKTISPQLTKAIQDIRKTSKRLLKKRGRGK